MKSLTPTKLTLTHSLRRETKEESERMLPKAIIDLTESFIRAYDGDHPSSVQFRKIQQRVLWEENARGFGSATLVKIRDGTIAYVEGRMGSIWQRLKESVVAADIDWYPELASDLVQQMTIWNKGVFEGVERSMEMLCEHHKIKLIYAPVDASLRTLKMQMKAEIDLFAAQHEAATKRKKESAVQTVVYNLHGANPRINIGSNDFSINISNSEKIFTELRKAIESAIEDATLKKELLTKTAELESEVGKSGFLKKYTDFVALAANHMTVLGPFIPALTKLLPQ